MEIKIKVYNRFGEPFGIRQISIEQAREFVQENSWTTEPQPITCTGDPGEWGNQGWTGLTAIAAEVKEDMEK